MIASLMMYAHPALKGPQGRYWGLIRDAMAARDIDSPAELSNDADAMKVWRDPDLVLSQTCGMPYRLWLKDDVQLVGTPNYGVTGCPPGYYASPIVVRADDPRTQLDDFRTARLAFNQSHSQSGWASIYNHLQPRGWWFSDRHQSHGHASSARAVAEGKADIAALDAVSWRIMQAYEGFAKKLRVLEWTAPTPGLPYITGPDTDADAVFDAVTTALDGLAETDRAALGIKGLVRIPKADYLAVPNPPESAETD